MNGLRVITSTSISTLLRLLPRYGWSPYLVKKHTLAHFGFTFLIRLILAYFYFRFSALLRVHQTINNADPTAATPLKHVLFVPVVDLRTLLRLVGPDSVPERAVLVPVVPPNILLSNWTPVNYCCCASMRQKGEGRTVAVVGHLLVQCYACSYWRLGSIYW